MSIRSCAHQGARRYLVIVVNCQQSDQIYLEALLMSRPDAIAESSIHYSGKCCFTMVALPAKIAAEMHPMPAPQM